MTYANPSPQFSHDLYPGLEVELDAVFTPHDDALLPGEHTEPNLETAVHSALEGYSELYDPDWKDISNWARRDLLDQSNPESPLVHLKRLEGVLGQAVPYNLAALYGEGTPAFTPTLERLYAAKQALDNSGETGRVGTPIGETMHLALIPWKFFRTHLENIKGAMESLREVQFGNEMSEIILPSLNGAIANGEPIYRDSVDHSIFMSASEYLDNKIATDGEWGLMLIQTVAFPGTTSLASLPRDKMEDKILDTNNPLEIGGQYVDGLGIFEWLALTMQQNETISGFGGPSLLTANRLHTTRGEKIPFAEYKLDRFYIVYTHEDIMYQGAQPRLTVL